MRCERCGCAVLGCTCGNYAAVEETVRQQKERQKMNRTEIVADLSDETRVDLFCCNVTLAAWVKVIETHRERVQQHKDYCTRLLLRTAFVDDIRLRLRGQPHEAFGLMHELLRNQADVKALAGAFNQYNHYRSVDVDGMVMEALKEIVERVTAKTNAEREETV